MHVDAIWLVHYESAFAVGAEGNMIFVPNVFERKDVGDSICIVPYITVVGNVGSQVGGECTTITVGCRRVICLPNTGDKIAVAKRINN